MLKKLIEPLQIVKGNTMLILIVVEAAIALVAWQILGSALIPSPLKVAETIIHILGTQYFYDNFVSSMGLTIQGMGISLIVAVLISYSSLIPVFQPIAKFVIKARYLTVSGLIFLFILLTKDGHQLKLNLLIFGIVPFFVTSFMSIIENINVQEYELCKTLRMNNWQTLWEVVIVGRADQVIEVMRQNFAIAWLMITMVEGLSMSEGGLGTMVIKSSKYLDLATVFAVLAIIFVTGVLFDYLLAIIRHWLFPYTKLHLRK